MTRATWLTVSQIGGKLDEATALGVVRSFRAKALDALPLYLVDAENRRSESPELAGGLVKDLRVEGGRLQALVEPRTKALKSSTSGRRSDGWRS